MHHESQLLESYKLTPTLFSAGVQVYPSLLHPSTPSCLSVSLMEWVVHRSFLLMSQCSWVQNSIPSHRCPQSYWLKIQLRLFSTWFFLSCFPFLQFLDSPFASFTPPFLCPNFPQTDSNPLIAFIH